VIRRGRVHVAMAVLAAVLLVFVLRNVDFAKFRAALGGVAWAWAGSILVLNLANTWFEAMRWRVILGSIKPAARTVNTFAAMLAGVAGNTVLPFRLGDGLRAYVGSRREHVTLATALGTVMLDRVADVSTFLALVILTGLFFHLPSMVQRAEVLAGVALVVALILMLLLPRFHRYLEPRLTTTLGKRIVNQVNRFALGLSALKDAGLLFPVGLLSVISWMVRLVMVMVIFKAFHLGLSFLPAAVFLIFSNLGIAAVSTPANIGGFEIAGLAALRLFGVDTETALGCTLVFHMLEVVPMALLGLVVLWAGGFKSRDFLAQAGSKQ
jgi:uncharacterized protein (TIRG00374 family)